jgi:hypothetical protein
MPAIPKEAAVERLAMTVASVSPSELQEVYLELFPEKSAPPAPDRGAVLRHIRNQLAAEEVVDLWNVVFPVDRNVWYDEDADTLHYNEELAGYAG